jgi:hypothetical protein
MRRTRVIVAIGGSAVVVVALVMACTGDDPLVVSSADGGAAGNDGGVEGASADGPSTDTGATDGATSDACTGTIGKTRCGCAKPSDVCCPHGDGGFDCVDPDDASSRCADTEVIRCAGTRTCPPSNYCCFNGTLIKKETCPVQLSQFDTECVEKDGGPDNCLGTGPKAIICDQQADCDALDAGTCVLAKMEDLDFKFGACVK